MSKREAIVQAAKDLIWEGGYEAMSPRDVMRRSGAGQGSLYHHFKGKRDLAAQALWEVNAELRAIADRVFSHQERPPLERVRRFLNALSRDPLKGCRVGRLAAESSIKDEPIRAPVAAWFEYAEGKIKEALEEAQADGQLREGVDVGDVALTITALLQGGYLVAKAHHDPAAMHRALAGGMALLESSTN
ncbi:MAG TPA: TetR/AcrR family transcriptional regulator [Candidatus Dormibacteraeota bacterium]|nr:TetR/AcrR family transcriptional regulator [Candidatus Dormibacteraeota bacterium]